jgi:hypothetical protein
MSVNLAFQRPAREKVRDRIHSHQSSGELATTLFIYLFVILFNTTPFCDCNFREQPCKHQAYRSLINMALRGRIPNSFRTVLGRAGIRSETTIRCASSSSASSPSSVSGPSKTSHSWERSAKMVKNIDVTNKYLEHIRDVHDPSMHIKTLEDELRGTMGKALGKQGDKILRALRSMQEELDRYHELLDQNHSISSPIVLKHAQQYNYYREQAKTARWELIVHRQAIGFIVNNHKFVSDKYPISPALPETEEELVALENKEEEEEEKPKANINGQLDWWQRIGRWR